VQTLVRNDKLVAYHDKGDGGLLVTLAEMAFAGHCGIKTNIETLGDDALAALFNEELGAVVQVKNDELNAVLATLAAHGLEACAHVIGEVEASDRWLITCGEEVLIERSRTELRTIWAEMTHKMQALRDNSACADQEFAAKQDNR
ncbi:AIR synthase-related protein, partial [Vibrio fluvialis]